MKLLFIPIFLLSSALSAASTIPTTLLAVSEKLVHRTIAPLLQQNVYKHIVFRHFRNDLIHNTEADVVASCVAYNLQKQWKTPKIHTGRPVSLPGINPFGLETTPYPSDLEILLASKNFARKNVLTLLFTSREFAGNVILPHVQKIEAFPIILDFELKDLEA